MSYVTLEAQIDHGKVVVDEPERLPKSARALLTILGPVSSVLAPANPLEALEALQKHLKLDENRAAEWMATVREARR